MEATELAQARRFSDSEKEKKQNRRPSGRTAVT